MMINISILSPFSTFAPIFGLPMKMSNFYPHFTFGHRPFVSFNHIFPQHYYVLPFIVVDKIKMLKRGYHVLFFDASFLTNFSVIKKKS